GATREGIVEIRGLDERDRRKFGIELIVTSEQIEITIVTPLCKNGRAAHRHHEREAVAIDAPRDAVPLGPVEQQIVVWYQDSVIVDLGLPRERHDPIRVGPRRYWSEPVIADLEVLREECRDGCGGG